MFTLVVTAYLFLRPAKPKARASQADARHIRDLLGRYGDRDSLGYFALRSDKNVIWSHTGKACIGYRVVSGVMLASGDPIGDPEAWPGAMHAFLDEAARHAWVPAVMGCGELGAEIWCRESELTALELGDEAIVEVADFTLQGRAMRNVRQMVARVCRQGYVADIRRVADIDRDEIDRIVSRADSWRGSPTERGFSMALGRVGGVEDGQCVVATATENGVLRGLLHFVPWGSDGLSLDLMRRDRNAQPGVNDFLIVEAIKAAHDAGGQADLAQLRGLPRRAGAGRADRGGPGAADLAPLPRLHLPVVPDRVAVQVQRQVLPGLGAALLCLPRAQGRGPGRRGRAGSRGVPGLAPAGTAPARPQAGLARARRYVRRVLHTGPAAQRIGR